MYLERPCKGVDNMKKIYKLPNGELTQPFVWGYHLAPVVIARLEEGRELDLELQATYGKENIHCKQLMTGSMDSDDYKYMNFYYVTGVEENAPKYEVIDYHEPERSWRAEPVNYILECVLHYEEYRKILRFPVSRINVPLTEFIDNIKEEIFEEDEEYATVSFFDNTGWDYDIDLNIDNLEDYIVSIRFVQEVN